MSLQPVKMRARGFICVSAHPEGCRLNVEQQIRAITDHHPVSLCGPRNVLVIGSSTGYGLASRIAAAWGLKARTLVVFFERSPDDPRTATAGFYNTVAFHQAANRDALFAASINGDAFSDAIKQQAVKILRREMAPVDLVIYSLASPKRIHPRTGEVHNSALKPTGEPYTSKTIELESQRVVPITLQPASDQEIADTIAVMGGDDWKLWMDALLEANLLAPGARTLAYSYIGPAVTWPIYRDGTIGRAKQDLEAAAADLDKRLADRFGGHAWVSVNKAVVTQASSAIPVVPLYLSLLPPIMRSKGLEESPIEQMRRLFFDHLADGKTPMLDDHRRIRLDDRELRPDVQADIIEKWPQVTTENLLSLTDFVGFRRAFRNLFGFDVDGVEYEKPVEIDLRW